jgi:1,4-alpha-glucan branching enzyme
MHRWDRGGEGDDVLVVFNFSNRTFPNYRVGCPRGGQWQLRFNSDAPGYDVDFGDTPAFDAFAECESYDGLAFSANISLPPYTTLIFSQ